MTEKTVSSRDETQRNELVRSHFEKGMRQLRREEYVAAIREFDEVLKLKPSSAEAYKYRGDAQAWLLRYDEADASYRRAISGDGVEAEEPDTRGEAYNELGEVFYSRRRFEDAVKNYLEAARQFDDLEQSYRKASDHLQANKYEARSGDMHNSCGFALLALRRPEAALEELRIAIRKGPKYPYAYHSLASLLWNQGKYEEAKEAWKDAYYRYDDEAILDEAEASYWPGHFINFGNLLHEVFGEFDEAEKMYRKALSMRNQDVPTRAGLLNLYLEMAACAAGPAEVYRKAKTGRAEIYCKAKAVYDETRELLVKKIESSFDLQSVLLLGDIYLAWNNYDGAGRWRAEGDDAWIEGWLKRALQEDKEGAAFAGYTRTAKPLTSLGVLYSRQKNYPKAITHFRQALEIESDDLTLRSNLAETYLRANYLDDAEREYKYILGMAPAHLESLIGLGEVYVAYGDANDPDMYTYAVTMLTAALRIAKLGKGSKRLTKKEEAKVLYLRAYARVKTFEGSKLVKDQRPLFLARDDFRLCSKTDPELYLAQHAIEKIENNITSHSPQRLMEKFGPLLILLSATAVLVFAQISFFRGGAKITAQYISMTFGALLLMAASSYLPQVLKLKFAGLELEKSMVDQVTTLGTLGITKGV